MIYVAHDVGPRRSRYSDLIDMAVARNAFGRQIDSFETDLPMPALGARPVPGSVHPRAADQLQSGPAVQVLAALPDGTVVAAQQGRILVTSFHPELTGDLRIHRYFLEQCAQARATTRSRNHGERRLDP